jgi:hypothetical protein
MTMSKANPEQPRSFERKQRKARNSFIQGFTRGFGSIGFVFLPVESLPKQSSLLSNLSRTPVAQRHVVINAETWRTVAKYMGQEFADRLSSSVSSTRKGQARDSQMIGRDFANAISKLDA